MIPPKARESRRMKGLKLSKSLEGIYKESKCREFSVVVIPMDFAKILGKFTKVKIKYESSSTSKSKRNLNQVSPTSRLKSNENGKLPSRRTTYNPHPAQILSGPKKSKAENATPSTKNVLKENNKLKKTILNFSLDTNEEINIYNTNVKLISTKKLYGIVFENPKIKKKEVKSKISLEDLIPHIKSDMLPSEYWCIDYFPKHGEPKNDKVYDRIAAELEDLMYDEKKSSGLRKDEKTDEFPSIMDILNDDPKVVSNNKSKESTVSLESNDVEAMLLGKSDTKLPESVAMDVDNTDVSSFLTGVKSLPSVQTTGNKQGDKQPEPATIEESPDSPSILDENSQKETTSSESTEKAKASETQNKTVTNTASTPKIDENYNTNADNRNNLPNSRAGVTQVIFKKNVNGTCLKSVICPKNLKYNICMLGKPVELLGAPKIISSLEDLQVLLQIVDESNLDNLYVLH